MSKFDFDIFYGGYDNLAVSKEKYSKEQAIEIAKENLNMAENKTRCIWLSVMDMQDIGRAEMKMVSAVLDGGWNIKNINRVAPVGYSM